MGIWSKTFSLLLVVLFIASSVMLLPATVRATSPRTLIVPDDYPTIQAAIDNANAGETIFVKDGTYNVTGSINGITINKSLSIIGQDKQTTIIEDEGSYYANSVIEITVDNVTVSGFTIDGNGVPTGIHLEGSNCKISDDAIASNGFVGIQAENSENNVISANNITVSGTYGIYLASSNSVIIGNIISTNSIGTGIIIDSCGNVTIKQNNISHNENGVIIRFYGPFYVHNNNLIDNSGFGLQFAENCSNSMIYDNKFVHNQIGIDLMDFATTASLAPLRVDGYPLGTGNAVYQNIFDNHINAKVEHAFLSDVGYVSNGTDVVSWNKGLIGNYWSDYNNPFAYVIDENNVDHYPLPYLSTFIIAIIAIVMVVILVVGLWVYFKKHKHKEV